MSAFQCTPGGPAAVVTCDCRHMPIIYSNKYNIDITKLYQGPKKVIPPTQPMLLDKPAQVHHAIKDRVLALYKPIEALDVVEKYNLFHFVSDSIRRRRVDKIVELMNLAPLRLPRPITWDEFYDYVLHPLTIQMMGSVMACKLAIDVGWGMNIGGGFSHETTNAGGGLSVYDDVEVCLSLIAEIPTVKHILVVNLDAYQSPCYKHATTVSCQVSIIDFYSELISEDHGYSRSINKEVCYMGFMVRNEEEKSTADYLSHFSSVTRNYLDKVEVMPSLCIYVAGTTVLADNPHTKMKFTIEGVIKRDHTVLQLMKHYKIPIAFLMGGGYQAYDVKATAMSIIKLSDNELLDKKLAGKVYRLI